VSGRHTLGPAIKAGLWLATGSLLMVSCGGGGAPLSAKSSTTTEGTSSTSTSSATSTSSTSSTTTPQTHPSTPVENGFGQSEQFCAQAPLIGTLDYLTTAGNATMQVKVDGLPSQSLVVIDWANNTVRGYTVGSIRTDSSGASIPASLNLFRPGETRGYKVVLTTEASDPMTLGTLWPCSSPSVDPAANVVDPVVTVMPDTGLKDGQSIRVSVSGFGQYEKVFLSECDEAEDANVSGCGPRVPAQPFIVAEGDRAGSTMFVVHSVAASKPFNTTTVRPCTNLCVVVATEGNGAWAVAPIAFGSSQLINP
jgi:hypothetical protein